MESRGEVTSVLERLHGGDSLAADELLPLVYGQLRGLAERCMGGERDDHTLQATALVHEAYIRLTPGLDVSWEDRGHFFAVAAKAMRRVLVDHARAKKTDKRGGGALREELEHLELDAATGAQHLDLLVLHEALERLELQDERKARVVELRYFAGLSSDETAEVLGVTSRTVDRDWLFAQAWLSQDLSEAALAVE